MPHQHSNRNPVRLSLEALEARLAPAVLADFEFTMPDRFGLDANADGRIDLPNSASYVNPGTFQVDLDGQVSGISRAAQFRWTISGAGLPSPITLAGLDVSAQLPEGSYTVRFDVLDSAAGNVAVTKPIVVDDVLIVALGDGYASGNGNPEVRNPLSPQWAVGATEAISQAHQQANRSTSAYTSQVALDVEHANPKSSVTFLNLAAINAEAGDVIGQIAELRNLVGNRPIESVLLSVGAQDVALTNKLLRLYFRVPPNLIPPLTFDAIEQDFQDKLALLPGRFTAINNALHQNLNVGNVYLTEYPDFTSAAHGGVCNDILDDATPEWFEFALSLVPVVGDTLQFILGQFKINGAEAEFVRDNLFLPLRNQMRAAAFDVGWESVEGTSFAFQKHGYCVSPTSQGLNDFSPSARYIRNAPESLLFQGGVGGTLLPSETGHQILADLLAPRVLEDLGPSADAGGPYTVTASQSVLLSAGGLRPPPNTTFEWDLNFLPSQGFTTDATGQSVLFTAPASQLQTTRIVALRVTDLGGFSNTDTAHVIIFPNAGATLSSGNLRVNGTVGADTITIDATFSSITVRVNGLPQQAFFKGHVNRIQVFGFTGDDLLQATANVTKIVDFLGNEGNDTILGGAGPDTLDGGDGDDFLDGRGGADLILAGPGNDTIVIDPDDTEGSFFDDVDAGPGFDGLLVRGSNQGDVIFVARRVDADGAHAILTVNGFTFEVLYLNGETVIVQAEGGNDAVIMDETAGETWQALFEGGKGHDLLVGAQNDDELDGGKGHDVLIGRGGLDTFFAEKGKDAVLNTVDWELLIALVTHRRGDRPFFKDFA